MIDKEKKESVEEMKLRKAESELLSGKRIVFLPSFGNITISYPSISVSQSVEKVYAEEFIKLLEEGKLPTVKQLKKTLKSRGIWTDEDNKELESLLREMQSVLISLNESKLKYSKAAESNQDNIQELENKVMEIEKTRFELQRKFTEKTMYHQNLLASTVEQRSDRKALFHKVYLCTAKEDGKRLFKNEQKMWDYNDTNDMNRLCIECVNFWSGIEDPFLERLAEEMIGS